MEIALLQLLFAGQIGQSSLAFSDPTHYCELARTAEENGLECLDVLPCAETAKKVHKAGLKIGTGSGSKDTWVLAETSDAVATR